MVAKHKWRLPGGWTWEKVNEHFRKERKKKAFIGRLQDSNYDRKHLTMSSGPK